MTIYKLYKQQQYMYKNKVHSVANRIVSITQPWIRPIVRGKTKSPVEFLEDQVLQNNQHKRKNKNTKITQIELR